MISDKEANYRLAKHKQEWTYRVERNVGPEGPRDNTWKITTYPIGKRYPVFDVYVETLPEWLDGIVLTLDASDTYMIQIGTLGSRLSKDVYWIKRE